MMTLITLVAALILLYLGYLTSVFSVSVFIDPDQLRRLSANQRPRRREFLEELTRNPAAFIQVATFYKWLSFLALGVLVYQTHNGLADWTGLSRTLTFALGLIWVFALAFLILEALPRRRSLQSLDERFLRLTPALRIARAFSAFYVRLVGGAVRRQEALTEELKEDIVERAIETLAEQVGAGEKIVDEDEREMIENIFQLDTTRALEIMTPRVDMIAVSEESTLKELRSIAREHGHSRLPVYRGSPDTIVGVLYIKDIFTHPPANPESFRIADYMKEPFFVPAEVPIDQLLKSFRTRKTHLAIALDEFGGAAGVVSLEDVLEVIVGDIQDEHDEEEAAFVTLPGDIYEIEGGLSVEDLVEKLKLDRQVGPFETVAGLLYDLVGSVPSEGVEVRWGDVGLTVTRLDGQRIDRIQVRRYPQP